MNAALFNFLSAVLLPLLVFFLAVAGYILWNLPRWVWKFIFFLGCEPGLEIFACMFAFGVLFGLALFGYWGFRAGVFILHSLGAHS